MNHLQRIIQTINDSLLFTSWSCPLKFICVQKILKTEEETNDIYLLTVLWKFQIHDGG